MIRNIALALTVAAVSTSAAAQSNRALNYHDFAKPYEAKTNPAVPIAPPQPAVTAAPPRPAQIDAPMPTTTEPAAAAPEVTTALKDACVIQAIGRLPKIDGMRVTHSSYEFWKTERQTTSGKVFVSVDVHGHQAQYIWLCGVSASGIVVLVAMR